jgi:hypothetical protein
VIDVWQRKLFMLKSSMAWFFLLLEYVLSLFLFVLRKVAFSEKESLRSGQHHKPNKIIKMPLLFRNAQ